MHCWSFIFVVFDGLTRKLRTTIWLRVVRFVVISVSSVKEHESDGLQYEKLRFGLGQNQSIPYNTA